MLTQVVINFVAKITANVVEDRGAPVAGAGLVMEVATWRGPARALA
jgi:hypothetical protein